MRLEEFLRKIADVILSAGLDKEDYKRWLVTTALWNSLYYMARLSRYRDESYDRKLQCLQYLVEYIEDAKIFDLENNIPKIANKIRREMIEMGCIDYVSPEDLDELYRNVRVYEKEYWL